MLFNSYVFILVFLPLALVLYYGLNRRAHFELAKIALILMSIWFYAYFHWSYVFILRPATNCGKKTTKSP